MSWEIRENSNRFSSISCPMQRRRWTKGAGYASSPPIITAWLKLASLIRAPGSRLRIFPGCSIPSSRPRKSVPEPDLAFPYVTGSSISITAAYRFPVPLGPVQRSPSKYLPGSDMKKILIVDDDRETRTNLSKIMIGAGYHTQEAASGSEAVEKATDEEFDLVL